MKTVSITPVIGTVAAGIATAGSSGQKILTSAALFGSVVAGQKVYGPGIEFGTKVASVETTSSLTLDKNITLTGAKTVQFSYFASTAYSAGDCLGWPFEIPLNKIGNIFIIDIIKQITAAKLYVFSKVPATATLDNAAFAPPDADARNLIGYYSLTGTVALSANQVIFPADTELPLAQVGDTAMYGQLVVVGTPTFTAINEITVNISGE